MSRSLVLLGAVLMALTSSAAVAPERNPDLARYFESATERLATNAFHGLDSRAAWEARRDGLRRQLLDMLGLWPLPERADLRATVTGRIERDDLIVEKLHFQSLPGLYVTANLYRPREIQEPLPAILYVCGHAQVRTNGVSCGNKTAYQHHGIWLARHGYVALLIDTLQLGEIEGDHHGTHRLGQWWWNSRGYTPAGVEAWNSIRALDYLESRPEVDRSRLGITGRSGGGSYSWTTAAVDERIRVAAPVAGITDLRNHIVDGTVEGHCDCMFFVNTHRWDYGLNAALLAPRPLLIVNTDADSIFPLDGVQRVHAQVRRLYDLHGAGANLGLVIAPGPHKDTQDLQVPVFRWFNRHLRGVDPLIEDAAVRLFDPLELRVFSALPADQRNTRAQEWFGPAAADPAEAVADADRTLARLRERVFAAWPPEDLPMEGPTLIEQARHGDLEVRTWEVQSEPQVPLELRVITYPGQVPAAVTLHLIDDADWEAWKRLGPAGWCEVRGGGPRESMAVALLSLRGLGPGAWAGDARKQVQIRRRFMLLGGTLDGQRVWDLRRGIRAFRVLFPGLRHLDVAARGPLAVHAVYAALFEAGPRRLRLQELPASLRREAPDYLNVLQVLDLPEALALVRRRGIEVDLEGEVR